MGKTGREIEHLMVFPGQRLREPLTERGRTDPDVDADVEDLSPCAFDKFPHGRGIVLIVQAAEDPFF